VDAQQLLLRLQAEDTSIDQVRHRREAHPARLGLREAEAEAARLEERRRALQAQLTELTDRQSSLEADVETAVSRATALDKRLYSGEIADPRDLQAASDQVASLKRRQKSLEDDILLVMEEREPLDAELAALDGEVGRLEARRAELTAELAEAEAALADEEARHQEARQALVPSVPPALLDQYEHLRRHLGGVGAAQIVNGSCSGCHLSLPATELARIRRAPEDEVVTCEQCGRILVRG